MLSAVLLSSSCLKKKKWGHLKPGNTLVRCNKRNPPQTYAERFKHKYAASKTKRPLAFYKKSQCLYTASNHVLSSLIYLYYIKLNAEINQFKADLKAWKLIASKRLIIVS